MERYFKNPFFREKYADFYSIIFWIGTTMFKSTLKFKKATLKFFKIDVTYLINFQGYS